MFIQKGYLSHNLNDCSNPTDQCLNPDLIPTFGSSLTFLQKDNCVRVMIGDKHDKEHGRPVLFWVII